MRFYGEAAALPFGAAFRHLAKVAAVLGVFLAVTLVSAMIAFNHVMAWCGENLPVITIRNGEASADVPQPKVIECGAGGKESFAVIIDTTGAVTAIDPRHPNGVLIGKRGLIIKGGDRVYPVSFLDRSSFTLDRAYFTGLIIRPAWIALAGVAVFPGALAVLFVQSAAAAALAVAVSRLRGPGCAFLPALQMSFYAAALAVCFLLAVVLVGIRLHPVFFLAMYAFVHAAFLIGAVLSAGGGADAA